MFWEEDEDKSIPYEIPDDVIDISFAIKCKKLHLDHAWELSEAVQAELPWIKDEALLGIHQIHVAETGNGWLRPDNDENAFLWPSLRTRFSLRVPKSRVDDVGQLEGKTLDVKGNSVTLSKRKTKELTNASVLFCRQVISNNDEDEDSFLSRMHQQIFELSGVKVRKLICGKSGSLKTPDGALATQHLMVADLESDLSIKIQQHGLGEGRLLGCGLFLPHKGIKSLHTTE